MAMLNLSSLLIVEEIVGSYDDHLFHTASCENHCLHHLLPVAKSTEYALRVWSWPVIRTRFV